MSLRLNWYLGGLHVPFYYGKDEGFYAAEGIDLTINEGRGSANTVQVVAAGSDTFGLADSSSVILTAAQGRRRQARDVAPQLDRLLGRLARRDEASRRRRTSKARGSRSRPAIRSASCCRRCARRTTSTATRSAMVQVDPAAKVVTVLEKKADALLGGADDQYFLIKQQGRRAGGDALRRLGREHRRHDDPHVKTDTMQEESGPGASASCARSAKSWEEAKKNPGAAVDAALKVEARPQSPVDARPADGRHRPAGLEELEGQASAGARRRTGTRRSTILKQYRELTTDQAVDGVPHQRVPAAVKWRGRRIGRRRRRE